jgi:TPR repeat protein
MRNLDMSPFDEKTHIAIENSGNLRESIDYLKFGVEQGSAYAQHKLGCAYQAGEGVLQDLEMAKMLYVDSLSLGNSLSAYNLGNIYLYENAVSAAVETLRRGADFDEPCSMSLLGRLITSDPNYLPIFAEGKRFLVRASAMGSIRSERQLLSLAVCKSRNPFAWILYFFRIIFLSLKAGILVAISGTDAIF